MEPGDVDKEIDREEESRIFFFQMTSNGYI